MARTARAHSAFGLDHAAGLAIWLGWGAVCLTLLAHTSQAAGVAGRYSLSFGLILAACLAVFVGLGGLLLLSWRRWPAILRRQLSALPPGLLPAYLITGAAALVWISRLGFLWNAVTRQPSLQIGLAAIYTGCGVLLYGAAAGSQETHPAWPLAAIGPGRRALAALLLAVPAWLFSAAAGLWPTFGHGLIALPGLLVLVLSAYALSSPGALALIHRRWAGLRAVVQGNWPAIGAALVVAYILIIYSPGLRHALLGDDELRLLWSSYAPLSYARWAAANPLPVPLIRPLFSLQAAVLYRLFGLNAGAYLAVEVLTLTASCLLVFYLVWRTSRQGLPALAAAWLLASHAYVSDLVSGWGFDTGPLTGVMVVTALWIVLAGRARYRSYLALAAVMLLAPVSRENGLALPGAVAFYSLAAGLGRWQPRRRVAVLLVLSGVCVAGYFAWRSVAFPGWWRQLSTFGESTAMFFQYYSNEAIQALSGAARLQLNLYTVGANLLANTLPIFDPYGGIWAGPLTAWAVIPACLVTLVVALAARPTLRQPEAAAEGRRGRRQMAGVAVVVAGLSLLIFSLAAIPAWFTAPALDLNMLQFALHATLTLGAALALAGGRRWSRALIVIALFGLGLILANSLVNFPYFRYRSQYLGYIGWVLLIAISLGGRPSRSWRSYLRQALLVLALALALINGARVFTSLPVPRLLPANYHYVGLLCDPSFPPELSAAIGDRYQLDAQRLLACRSAPPVNPTP